MIFILECLSLIFLCTSSLHLMKNVHTAYLNLKKTQDMTKNESLNYYCAKLLVSSKNINDAYNYLNVFAKKENNSLKNFYNHYQDKINIFFEQKCAHTSKKKLLKYIKKEINTDLPAVFPNWIVDIKSLIKDTKI